MWRSATIGSTVVGAIAAATAAWYADYLPMPVLDSELQPIVERLAAAEQLTREQALYVTERRLAEFRHARAEYVDKGQPVPAWLDEQIRRLQRQIQKLERDLGLR